jgi:hypothetical protein
MDLKACGSKNSMETEATQMVAIMEKLLNEDDATTAWNMQSEFLRIWKSQPLNSPEREAMAAVWNEMMNKWH